MGKRRNPRRNKNTLSFGHFPIWGEGPPAKIGLDTFLSRVLYEGSVELKVLAMLK